MCSDSNQRVVAGTIIGHAHELKFEEKKRIDNANTRESKFLRSALALANIWSKDPSSKVCCIAVGETHNLVAFGYNGFPPGIADTSERLSDRDFKLRLTVHAEINALTNAWFKVKELYVTHHPCDICAPRILAERTVERIVYIKNEEYENRWKEEIAFARKVFSEAKIQLIEVVL